jgi:hypothetical protein
MPLASTYQAIRFQVGSTHNEGGIIMDVFGRGKVHHSPGDARSTEPTSAPPSLARGTGTRKGYDVRVHPGMTDNQVAQAGTKHLISDAVVDPGTSLNLRDSMGKRVPIPAQHPGTPDQKLGAKYDPDCANRVIGEAKFSGSTRLPGEVSEQ